MEISCASKIFESAQKICRNVGFYEVKPAGWLYLCVFLKRYITFVLIILVIWFKCFWLVVIGIIYCEQFLSIYRITKLFLFSCNISVVAELRYALTQQSFYKVNFSKETYFELDAFYGSHNIYITLALGALQK